MLKVKMVIYIVEAAQQSLTYIHEISIFPSQPATWNDSVQDSLSDSRNCGTREADMSEPLITLRYSPQFFRTGSRCWPTTTRRPYPVGPTPSALDELQSAFWKR